MAGQESYSQRTEISDVINDYGRITKIWNTVPDNPDSVVVNGASAIWDGTSPFEIALFIQIKGTDVYDPHNLPGPGTESLWGKVRNGIIRNTGIYSFMLVDRIVNDSIVIFSSSLRDDMVSQGSVPFSSQLIEVPYARSFRLTGDIRPEPWDPLTGTGGVLALFASDKLDLSGYNINAGKIGFAGADTSRTGTDPVICAFEDRTYYLDTAEHYAGRKGGSIIYEGYPYTRGNGWVLGGGGGGQGRFSGGAGGSNAGPGGRGGAEDKINCSGGEYFGRAGALNVAYFGNDQNRIFLGAGGGSSLPEEELTATPGGYGGGIVIIITDTIAGLPAGDTILTSGQSVIDTSFTGGGGGGAGGFIVLDVNHVEGNIHLDASGGKGGDTYDQALLHGPGGGGGGGVIWHSDSVLLPGLTENKSGGVRGEHLGVIGDHNAGDGTLGSTIPNLVVPLRGFYFNFISGDEDICQDSIPSTIIGSYPKGDTAFVFAWQDSISGGNWQIIPGATEKDYSPDTLTVSTWFRRIVTPVSEPTETDTSLLAVKTVFNRLKNNVIVAGDTICYDLIPVPLKQGPGSITGGNEVDRLYRWRAWQDSSPGWVMAGFLAQDGYDDRSEGFVPDRLQETTHFRRQVISHVCTHISDSLTITVLPDITGNSISGIDTVCQFTEPADTIRGITALGGGDGVYEYVWEAESDLADWDSMATSQDYFPGSMDTVTTSYRRRVYSGNDRACESLSNSVTIEVHPIITNNLIAPDTVICAETPTNDIYPDAQIEGGNDTYLYKFERSTDFASWSLARDWNAIDSYNPVELPENTWFRRLVVSGECADTSATILFAVDTVILNNLISPDDTICAGTQSGTIIGSVADGGDWSTYAYRWDRSTDRVSWDTDFYNNRDLPPQTLNDSTWYRRRVLSGVCRDTSYLVAVNVHANISGNDIRADTVQEKDACELLPKLIMGQDESSGLAGGTGKAEDFRYLWLKEVPSQSGTYIPAPADGPFSNDQVNYESDTLFGPGSIYAYRRYVESGKCFDTSQAVTLTVKQRPAGMITSDPTPTEDCYDGTSNIAITVQVSFEDYSNKPFRLVYNDGQGGTNVVENMDFYDGTFTAFRGTTDSSWYTIQIDSIIDKYGCRAIIDPEDDLGSRQMIVYQHRAPELVQDTFRVCGGDAALNVLAGLGSRRYWGPENDDYTIVPKDNPSAGFSLYNWTNDTLFYPVYWYQKNGVCQADSVMMVVELYQPPLQASVQPSDSIVYFRQIMPLWADTVPVGLGTWKDWDWDVNNAPPLTDIHNNRAVVDLGGTQDMRARVNRQLTWMVSNGECGSTEVQVRIERNDIVLYSAFSPNHMDQYNEYLILDGLEFADQFTMRIFSRHGILIRTVTEADKMSNPFTGEENIVWDGTLEDGSEAEDGTYFYMIEVIHAGEKYNYKNFLELIRNDQMQ